MATQVDIPFNGWSLSGQDQLKEGGNGLVQEMLDHGSISFGRYAIEPISWEKHSVFSHDARQDELNKLTYPGSVAQKKAYFEEYYKKIRGLKALEEDKPTQTESALEILAEHIDCDPKNDELRECEVNVSNVSMPEVVVQSEFSENVSTGKENIVEQENKSTLDSDCLSTSCVTEVAFEKNVHQIENGIVNHLQVAPRKKVDKVEHEQKLKRDFDSLSKDWVKLKKGMASIGGREREAENGNKNSKAASAVTKSVGAVKDTTISDRKKTRKPLIKSFKEPKLLAQKVNSGDAKNTRLSKLSIGSRVACNSRPNLSSSCNRPLIRAKNSVPSLNEGSRVMSKTVTKSASNPSLSKVKSTRRSSLDSLLKPTASSNARSIKSEDKRNSGVAKKLLSACVPRVLKRDASQTPLLKRRSSNIHAQGRVPRTRSDMASRVTPSHGKQPKLAKVTLISRKQVEPKKAFDSNTRSKKLVASRKEPLPTYKRIKLTECSPLKKKQRHEKPPWR